MTTTQDATSPGTTDVDRLHEQGLSFARQRRFDEALELFRATLKADPDRVEAIRHLAQACTDIGRLSEAETAWLQYLDRCPQPAEAHRHLGNLRRRMQKLDLAIESLQKAVGLDEKTPAFQIDLGIALAEAKRRPEAKQIFLRALELEPDCYDACINLGLLLQEMNEGKEAIAWLRKAVELRPNDPNGNNNLGVVLSEQGQFNEAIACLEQLLAKTPDYVLAWNNLGNSLRSAGRIDEAIPALHKVLEYKPDYTEAHNNLGIIHAQVGAFADAIRSYDRALLLRPDYPEAHANRGLIYLLLGNFQQGWADYEWRWQGGHGLKRRSFAGKLWDGSPLAGKRILLYFEQGLGNTFQFIRYAKELKARGATVIFECQPNTRQILARTPGIDEFVIRGEKPPSCDFYAPLLSLPGLCQTNLDNLPRRIPYIFTDPALVWDWKQRMTPMEGFRVGIVWQGNPDHKGDRYRSISLKAFASLANVPGVNLITLQKGLGTEQIEQLEGLFPITDFKNIAEDVDGWLRTGAIVSNLDLLICADTSVAHLAGAMGVPVWIAIQNSPDWRWLLEREDTPWYPTMRLFRQHKAGDWEEVFQRIAEALRERLSVSNKTMRRPATDTDQLDAQSLLRKAAEHINRQELAEAQGILEQAVRLDPMNGAVQQDLGVAYAKQGRLRDAIPCFRRALELTPDSPALYANLGLACFHAGYIDEAISHLRKAIWLGAGTADTHKNLARALTALPDPAAAEESYWAALRLQPDDAEAHYHLARVMLMQGKFEQGWLEYEWRWRWRNAPKRHLHQPRWSGQKIEGKTILILAEDDPRDTIQLARYADLIAQQGGRVILECQPHLAKLMQGCLGVDEVIPAGTPFPHYDFHTALLSLPATLGTTLSTVPAARPYLGVTTDALEFAKTRLQNLGGTKVGIALEGDSPSTNAPSSLLTACLKKLSPISEPSLLNLQPNSISKSIVSPQTSLRNLDLLPDNPQERMIAIGATLRNLDLLITADNTIAHVAGAMGVPTWVILPIVPEPLWLLNRSDTPWYPTVRLFRQRQRGDWDETVGRMTQTFQEFFSTHRGHERKTDIFRER